MSGRIVILAPKEAAAALQARLRQAFLEPAVARDVGDAAARLRAGEADLLLAAPDPGARFGSGGTGLPLGLVSAEARAPASSSSSPTSEATIPSAPARSAASRAAVASAGSISSRGAGARASAET
ncbi:MAG: hypothetical protein AAF763_13545, partial [Pseudomonadota bacterium]